ncbi:Mu-like prophage I protein [Corynebacterium coyleae]|uniref:Mu-like prophage I protein n=1 Tax=Corynebacterium coyleae TaxID=53374 RepID=A0ABX8KWC4_9CORY|nr:phage protease [Corynebacterium coyleae]QXB18933.1 hypothetical protein I6L55_02175 [Corynebacterium coyleae]WJY80495.1 Mu-like prophage I protein [Corynebacterium coyleae]SEB44139.1 Mu-like prophage I protein [Corynebacterium coyleae]
MKLFRKNERITFSENNAEETPATASAFTVEQWETLIAVLDLDEDADPAAIVAAVAELAEAHTGDENAADVAASSEQIEQPIIIDPAVWKDMQRSLKVGMTAEKQEHRLAAEQVVDQAIRLGKATASQRERWIAAYGQDPEATIHALNRADEIPRMEIGYGIDPEAGDGKNMPKGWVR